MDTKERTVCPKCGGKKHHNSKTCKNCRVYDDWKGKKHKESSKKLIGKASKKRAKDPAYKKKQRWIRERKGIWIPLDEVPDKKAYSLLANWVSKMFNRATEEEKELLKRIKVFNVKRNRKGAVRDHKYSRLEGFNNRVFPELLRHPVNCQIMSHADNASKRSKCSITLEQLFQGIENYTGRWKEQKHCLKLIEDYRKGERYEKENYICQR